MPDMQSTALHSFRPMNIETWSVTPSNESTFNLKLTLQVYAFQPCFLINVLETFYQIVYLNWSYLYCMP